MIRKYINKRNLKSLFTLLVFFTIVFATISNITAKGTRLIKTNDNLFSINGLSDMFSQFALPFVIYLIIVIVYCMIASYTLKNFFRSFINVIGEEPRFILAKINTLNLIKSVIALLVALKYRLITQIFISFFIKFFTGTGKYFHGTVGNALADITHNSYGIVNEMIMFLMLLALSALGFSVWVRVAKKLTIVKSNFIDPLDDFLQVAPFIGVLIYLYQALVVLF